MDDVAYELRTANLIQVVQLMDAGTPGELNVASNSSVRQRLMKIITQRTLRGIDEGNSGKNSTQD